MAFSRAISCNENPIESVEKDLLQRISDSHTEIAALIDNTEELVPDIDSLITEGNNLLQDLLSSGDPNSNIRVLDDLPENFGIDGDGSQTIDEKYLRNVAGIIMINGVVFKEAEGPNSDNIEVLRRIYQGVGRNLENTEKIYQTKGVNSFIFETIIQKLEPVIPNQQPTLQEIKRRIGVPWITEGQVVYTEKNQAIVVYRESVSQNEPLLTVSNRVNTPLEKLTSTIIHYEEILSTTASINHWISLGYSDKISFILDGTDPINSNPLPITSPIQRAKNLAASIVSDIEFVLSRIDKLNAGNIDKLRGRLIVKFDQTETLIVDSINTILFKVSTITEKDTLSQLRKKLSDEDIVYTLDERTDVLGIDLSATIEEINDVATKSKSIKAGDITASSKFLNQPVDSGDEVLTTLLNMFKLIQQAKEQSSIMTKNELEKAINTLALFIGEDPTTPAEPKDPVRGFPGMATPNSILSERLDYDKSFEINLKFKLLDDALEAFQSLFAEFITKPLTDLINMVSNVFKSVHALIDNLTGKLANEIFPLKRKLDSFMSKYLSLIGQGDFNSSILKCSVNFDIGLSTNILDQLLVLITDLGALVQNLVTEFQTIVSNMAETILCVPIQMVDKLVASGDTYFPSFCEVTIPIELGEDLNKALLDMRNSCSFKQVNFSGLTGDLVSYRAIVATADDRLGQFNKSSFCQSDLVDIAFNTTIVNIRGGIESPF